MQWHVLHEHLHVIYDIPQAKIQKVLCDLKTSKCLSRYFSQNLHWFEYSSLIWGLQSGANMNLIFAISNYCWAWISVGLCSSSSQNLHWFEYSSLIWDLQSGANLNLIFAIFSSYSSPRQTFIINYFELNYIKLSDIYRFLVNFIDRNQF